MSMKKQTMLARIAACVEDRFPELQASKGLLKGTWYKGFCPLFRLIC